MPSRLPVQDIFAGLVTSIGTAIRYWFHYTLVAFAWLGVVPLTACKPHLGIATNDYFHYLSVYLNNNFTLNIRGFKKFIKLSIT